MDVHWDDYRAVLAVVRRRTLSAAAEELGVNYTTVARRIARAETATGDVLFERLADGYRPTEAGHLVALHAAQMESSEHTMLRCLSGRDVRLEGKLILTAPQLLIAHILPPVLGEFALRHPSVTLHVRAANEILDLNRREADIAIRISRNPGDTLKGVRLAQQHSACFATVAWAEQMRKDPKAPVDWLLYEKQPNLPAGVNETYPNSRVHMRFDDMVAMAGAAQSGLGVVRMPMFLGRSLQGLVQVPKLAPQQYADIWIVAHPDVWPSAKLKALREIVLPFFRQRRPLFAA